MICKELGSAENHLGLAAFHIDLDNVWGRPATSYKVIERDCRHFNQFTISEYGARPVSLYTPLCSRFVSTPKRDSIACRLGPDCSMDCFKASDEVVLERVPAQAHNVIRITIERDNPPVLANESGCSEREISDMSADVIYNRSRINCCQKCALHFDIMLSAPVAGFIRKTELQPHSRLRQHIPAQHGLKYVQCTPGGRPLAHHSLYQALGREIQAIKEDKESCHIQWNSKCESGYGNLPIGLYQHPKFVRLVRL